MPRTRVEAGSCINLCARGHTMSQSLLYVGVRQCVRRQLNTNSSLNAPAPSGSELSRRLAELMAPQRYVRPARWSDSVVFQLPHICSVWSMQTQSRGGSTRCGRVGLVSGTQRRVLRMGGFAEDDLREARHDRKASTQDDARYLSNAVGGAMD